MEIPNGGWVMDGMSAATYSGLFSLWVEHHPPPLPLDLAQAFQDAFCRANPRVHCEAVAPVTNETRTLNAGDVIRFLRVLREWIGEGRELVPQAEAERRAEICAGCRYNVHVAGCSVCQGLAAKVTEIVGARSTRVDAQLQGCAICACENKSQVHLPLAVLHKGVTPEMEFPDWCWKKSQDFR